ncbi:MAG: hypothetical protein AAB787_02720 [Patescibacteria group bacterium]
MKGKAHIKIVSFFAVPIVLIGILWFVSRTDAFSGPSDLPGPFTSGVLRFDPVTGNFGIGIPPDATARVLVKSSATYPGLKILDNSNTPVLEAGPTEVKIGNPTGEALTGTGISLRVGGIKASSSYFENLFVNQARVYGSIIGGPGSSISGFDEISATTVSSSFSALNISSGVFGSGDFAFPGKLGVNTSDKDNLPASLSVYGTGYFSSNVGIGMTVPSSDPGALNIYSTNSWLSGFNKGIRLEGSSTIEFGGGTTGAGGVLYGIGVVSSRLFIFNTNTESNPAGSPSFYNLTLNSSGVGVGLSSPSATLHVSGTLKISGASGFQFSTSSMGSGKVLTSDSQGNATWANSAGIGAGFSGDTARYNGSSWVASSLLYNNGTFIGVGATTAPTDNLTLLKIGSTGYFQIDRTFSGAPTAAECSDSTENGRITIDTTSAQSYLYVCVNGAWKALKLN